MGSSSKYINIILSTWRACDSPNNGQPESFIPKHKARKSQLPKTLWDAPSVTWGSRYERSCHTCQNLSKWHATSQTNLRHTSTRTSVASQAPRLDHAASVPEWACTAHSFPEAAPLKKEVSPAERKLALETSGVPSPSTMAGLYITGRSRAQTIVHVSVALSCVASNHSPHQDFTVQSKRTKLYNSQGDYPFR